MWNFLANLFNTEGFSARWHCGAAWTAPHGWLHIVADVATFTAYFAVPCVVGYFVWGRRDLNFTRLFWLLFGLIFLSCGFVHLLEAIIFWWPAYRLSAVVKLVTATVSCIGVAVLMRAMPKALSLKTEDELAKIHSLRELAEESLRKSEERFQLAVNGTNDGLWDWNVLTGEVYYAPRFKELLGYDEEEMPNLFETWRGLLHPDDLEPTLDAVDAHLKDRVPYDVDYRLLTKSGEYRWFRARGQAIWDKTGRATRMAGSITDVTAQRNAEDALKSSQQLYLSLVENLPVHLIRKDLEGRFTFANQAFCALVGKSQQDILSTTDFDYFPRQLAEKYRQDDQWVAETGRLFEDVEENRDGDETRYFEVIKAPVHDATGKVDGIQAVFWDVTDRKRAELEMRRAKEEAEEASRAKSEFLANMSHEIRTPMNAVIGMTELVLETDLNPQQRDCLSTVLEAGESLLSVINQILDFSKIEAGRIELDPAPFELRELVGNTMKSLAPRAHRKELELAWRMDDQVPDRLVGDRTRLRQIIVNLVGNAVKFTEQGEVILNVELLESRDGWVDLGFFIKDTGIGIEPHLVDQIFEAFQQADTSTTRRFGGTGLGLSIVSRLTELMGGHVTVESTPGQGSTFSFTARMRVDTEKPSSSNIDPEVIRDTRVLIVDDNATNRKILQEILIGWGMSTHSVASGTAALEYLHELTAASQTLPLLITDLNMPDVDGFQLVEQIREQSALADLPVILLTSGGAGDPQSYTRLKIAAHLLKPVKQSELFDAVARATGARVSTSRTPSATENASTLPPLRVLLAEDGIANQKLAVGLLRKWGHEVVVAENGQEAVEAWRGDQFDLILMDVQMPEMDGVQATRVIRAEEQGTGRHIAIVAMTAHAMPGDREKCLDAGMDAYVPKPIRRNTLLAALEPLFPRRADSAKHSEGQSMELDMSAALEATDGDRDLLKAVVEALLEEIPQLMQQLETAIAEGDAKRVQRLAHTVKGNVRLFADSPVSRDARELEEMGASGDLSQAAETLAKLRVTADELLARLKQFMEGDSS